VVIVIVFLNDSGVMTINVSSQNTGAVNRVATEGTLMLAISILMTGIVSFKVNFDSSLVRAMSAEELVEVIILV